MEVLYLFVPLSMLVVAGLVWVAFWAIRNNQFDDLEGPAHRILMDDDDPKIPTQENGQDNGQGNDRREASVDTAEDAAAGHQGRQKPHAES
ncbi:MAG: cbb3-type cytochrome oxidase assembly protein CcoS [Halothiobacillaceae bacterium]|nr:cbb3-type cytochrome oxidase assembly protein CcoS [Halothiobacillaceae bacterium]HER34694.1 cbb3-type cytochrome oxidase assembly protein CcoS [Halothiobacillaceae bacterium]